MATSAPTGTTTSAPSTSASSHGRPWSTCQLRERDGADRGERRVAQRHLSRRAHQQAERQQHDRADQRRRQYESLSRPTTCGSTSEHDQHAAAGDEPHPCRGRGTASGRPALRMRRRHELAPRQHQQGHEQHEERQAAGSPDSQVTSRTYCVDTAEATPMPSPPANVSGMRGERPDRRRPERLHHQERQADRVQPDEAAATSTPDSAANVAADDPRDPPHPPRIGALHREQVGIVDDRAHRQPGPGEPEQGVQRRHGEHRDGDDHAAGRRYDRPAPGSVSLPWAATAGRWIVSAP